MFEMFKKGKGKVQTAGNITDEDIMAYKYQFQQGTKFEFLYLCVPSYWTLKNYIWLSDVPKIKCSVVTFPSGFCCLMFIYLWKLFVNSSMCANHPTCLEFRCSGPDMFDKKRVLENWATLTEKLPVSKSPFKESYKSVY